MGKIKSKFLVVLAIIAFIYCLFSIVDRCDESKYRKLVGIEFSGVVLSNKIGNNHGQLRLVIQTKNGQKVFEQFVNTKIENEFNPGDSIYKAKDTNLVFNNTGSKITFVFPYDNWSKDIK
jgi:hypothetical protein